MREAPSRPIARGLSGPGLLAHVLVSKYADHQPLYRQAKIYAREGVELERSTLADWVGATSELLAPLNNALRQYVLSADKLHADDTPVPVLAPGMGKTKSAVCGLMFGMIARPAIWLLQPQELSVCRIRCWRGCFSRSHTTRTSASCLCDSAGAMSIDTSSFPTTTTRIRSKYGELVC